MKEKLETKAVGFYFIVLAALLGVISLVRYAVWAPAHDAMDALTMAALVIGIVIGIILMVKDNDYLVIVMTVCYSIATVKLLTDSVGSFVDAIQGINMFGDSSQVGTIISIAAVMGVSILLSILSGFLKRVKE